VLSRPPITLAKSKRQLNRQVNAKITQQLFSVDRPIGVMHGVLDVAQHRIDPDEYLGPKLPLQPPGELRQFVAAGLPYRGKARRPIGTCTCLQVFAAPAGVFRLRNPLTGSMRIVSGLRLAGWVHTAARKRGVAPRAVAESVAAAPSARCSQTY
jgi:hypothetical protein